MIRVSPIIAGLFELPPPLLDADGRFESRFPSVTGGFDHIKWNIQLCKDSSQSVRMNNPSPGETGPYGVKRVSCSVELQAGSKYCEIYIPTNKIYSNQKFPIILLGQGDGIEPIQRQYLECLFIDHLVSHGFIVAMSRTNPDLLLQKAKQITDQEMGTGHYVDGKHAVISHSGGVMVLGPVSGSENRGTIMFASTYLWTPDVVRSAGNRVLVYYEPSRVSVFGRLEYSAQLLQGVANILRTHWMNELPNKENAVFIMDADSDHVVWNSWALRYNFTLFMKKIFGLAKNNVPYQSPQECFKQP